MSNSDLSSFYKHIDDVHVVMMTTRRADGHMQSRAMATQKRAAGADLWFVSYEGTTKLRDLEEDPHINLAYYKEKTGEWISVSGIAHTTRDRNKIRELYAADWKMWFPEEGDPRHGTADDPRMVLIGVDVHAAMFLEVNKPRPVVLYEVVKGWVTGSHPDIGEIHEVHK
jgi:general stress protein 26